MRPELLLIALSVAFGVATVFVRLIGRGEFGSSLTLTSPSPGEVHQSLLIELLRQDDD